MTFISQPEQKKIIIIIEAGTSPSFEIVIILFKLSVSLMHKMHIAQYMASYKGKDSESRGRGWRCLGSAQV